MGEASILAITPTVSEALVEKCREHFLCSSEVVGVFSQGTIRLRYRVGDGIREVRYEGRAE